MQDRFCSNCGTKLWQTWDGRTLSKLFWGVEPGKNVHRLAQDKLWKIGKDLGFHAITEFVPPNTNIQRSELIDVVWKSGNEIEFAFEIRVKESELDVLAAQADVEKLRQLKSPKKFLVNVSNKTGKAYFNEVTSESTASAQAFSTNQPVSHKITLNMPSLDEISKRFGMVEPGKSVRQQAIMKLLKVGTELGFSSYSWYEMPNLLNDGRSRFISVIWKTGNEIAVAFQVRRKRRNPHIVTSIKDKSKMRNLQAEEKYIVNISEKTGKPYFFRVTDEESTELRTIASKEGNFFDPEETKAYNVDEIRQKHPRAYEKWTEAEDLELTENYRKGLSVSQLAEKHQRKSGAVTSRLEKLGLVESQSRPEYSRVEEARLVTLLVKSEKHGRICLAGVDENKRWIRPIKPGGFSEEDIIMNNSKTIDIFDVVEMKFTTPYPIKHHTENMLLAPGSNINLAVKLGDASRNSLLSEIADPLILDAVYQGEDLHDKMVNFRHQSLVLLGPVDSFEIQSNIVTGKNHPRIWIVNPFNKQRMFYITCTDIRFCKFIKNKLAQDKGDGIISSQDVAELRDKQTYFVIGITGDSLDETGKTKDGRYAPPGSSIQPRYWPMVVSVLTVPYYSGECQNG